MTSHAHHAASQHPKAKAGSADRRTRPDAPRVLHHDDQLILVDKPARTWFEGGDETTPTVRRHLAKQNIISDPDEELRTIWPLDPETSGLLVLARNTEAADNLQGQLKDGSLDLCLLALVRGPVSHESGTLEQPVAQRGQYACIDLRDGRPAVTHWKVRDTFIGFALLECRPRTAVSGQIPVHLESAGFPLAVHGDAGRATRLMLSSFKAGYRPSRRHPERPLIQRMTLHAWSVALTHPTTGAQLRFEVPPPKDFRATLHQLDKHARIPPQ